MWKSLVVPLRCPRLWQEYAWRRKLSGDITVTVLDGNASMRSSLLESRNPNGSHKLFCDGYGCAPWWLRSNAIGGRRGSARAAIAEKEKEKEEEKEEAIGDQRSGETVVNMLSTENLLLPLEGMSGLVQNPLAGRRRTVSDCRMQFGGGRHGSLREFSQRAASETYLVTRLAITLLKLLGIGTRWIAKFLRLSLYAVFLMPGFIQVGYFYYFDKRIHRSITYGDQPRNRFDLYMPPDSDKPKPVVIFITGGAWVIGYKAWGSLLAQQLVERDVIVACIDYRNFPQGSISDMISDVSTGIGYVYQNIESYGGDPNMVYLAGQSAGAHLAACALLMQAEKEISGDPAKLVWRSSQIKAYLAISGGYNLIKLVEYFHSRGLYKSIMLRVMEGEKSLPVYSPEYMVKTPTFKKAVPLLPPITLFHGTGDYSIPHEASEAFAAALQSVGAQVNTVFYPDKTHTDLFLQDPMRGGKDELLADVLAVVHANDAEARAEDVKYAYFRRRLVPEILLQLARRVSPF